MRIFGKQTHRHQHIQKLRCFVDLPAHAVLHQIFALELLDGTVRESHVALVVEIIVELVEFGAAVVGQKMAVVFARFGEFAHMVKQMRRLELAISNFAQMENRQTRSQILVIGRFLRNQVGRSFDNGFVNIVGADAVVKLDMRFELNLRHRNIVQTGCCPVDYAVDFIQIDRLQPAVAFGYFQIACCVHRQIPSS